MGLGSFIVGHWIFFRGSPGLLPSNITAPISRVRTVLFFVNYLSESTLFFNRPTSNSYILLYPTFLPSAFHYENLAIITAEQHQCGVYKIQQPLNGATGEQSDEPYEPIDEGDGDEDVGEETSDDIWQSLIDYFGICEGRALAYSVIKLKPTTQESNKKPIRPAQS